MKKWSKTSKKEGESVGKKSDSNAVDVYKKEILDTRITVSRIFSNLRSSEGNRPKEDNLSKQKRSCLCLYSNKLS
ncbi:MAG: hypothetical protein WC726_04440 [Parcubacteria group bacterium]|jgi:hypothetical protein